MNRPIIKGTALHKSSQNTRVNPNDLRKTPDTPFRQDKTGEQETTEQYNARVRAEHEAKMQAYNDSTASYQNQVIIQNKLDEATGLETDNSGHVPETRYISGQDIVDAGGKVEGINWSKGKDADGNPIDPNTMYTIPIQGVTDEQKASNKVIADRTELQYQKGDRLIDEAYVLHEENKKRGIHSEDFSFNTNPDDLRPTKPREPMEMIDPIKIKNIDMGEPTTPDVIKPTKRKYMTSTDGKWKINLETGEKTRVKTQKVKKSTKPGKRSVRNLVTGGTNRVQ